MLQFLKRFKSAEYLD